MHQRVGNDEGSEEEHLFPIDVDGIFAVLPGAVRKDVHELQAFQRKEAEGGVDHKDPGKERRSADQHEKERQDFRKIPVHAAAGDRVDKHEECLQHSADPCQLEFASKHLQHFIPGTDQHLIKASRPHHGREGVEASCDHLRNGEFHQKDSEAKEHLLVGVALDAVKTLEHEIHAQKDAEGHEELS